jgi:hypothetical protein
LEGTLTGGTYQISGTLQFANAAIVTNAANVVLDGTGAQTERYRPAGQPGSPGFFS